MKQHIQPFLGVITVSKTIRSELAFNLNVQEDIRFKKRLPMDHIVDLSFQMVDVEDSSRVFGSMGVRLIPLLDDKFNAFEIVNDDSESLIEALELVSNQKPRWFSGEDSNELTPPFLVYIDSVDVEKGFERTILGETAAVMALEYISTRFFEGQDMYSMPVVWDTDHSFPTETGWLRVDFSEFSNFRPRNLFQQVNGTTYSFIPNFSPKNIADYSKEDIENTRSLSKIGQKSFQEAERRRLASESWAKSMSTGFNPSPPKKTNKATSP